MDFFQRAPPFLIQLQNILRKYPDGGQILKELIQNADDAKATEVTFVYDERQYGTDTLYSDKLHIIQGPALLAYNNEIFSDQDWEGIQKPGNSIKRKDPDTTGRFGLGFNSVYHITDYPAIFSGKNIGFLDPQEHIFHRGGCLWNLEKGRQDFEKLSDQFHPFQMTLEALGLGSWKDILESGYFNGTLFRFPLRLDPSDISDNIYSSERVRELFESFIIDARISLLFLRHVTKISLKNIDSNGTLTTLLTAEVSIEETIGNNSADLDVKTDIKIITLEKFGEDNDNSEWLVTSSTIQGNKFPDLIELSNKLCNKPSLDLAYPLSETCMDLHSGRLSCILPLPDKEENRTGLPLVINGTFDLTDDRRSLKWPEIDQQHDEAAKWNHILVNQVLPLLYKHAVCNVVSLVKLSRISAQKVYNIWPNPERTQHKNIWHELTRQMSNILMNEKVLQVADQSSWVTASKAIFLLQVEVKEENVCECLEEVLLLLKAALVKAPRHVALTLQLATKLHCVSPSLMRQLLRNDGWHKVSPENKMVLLRYIIKDGQYSELLNLQLLPLANGKFTCFQNTESNGMVYIDSKEFPRILLPGLAHQFIAENLMEDLRLFFENVGKRRTFKNLTFLNEEVVHRRLEEALPQRWRECPNVINWNPQDPNSPPVEWIRTLWDFLQQFPTLDRFENQPIVPINQVTKSRSNIKLARLKKNTTLLLQKKDRILLDDRISELLEKAGCTILREDNTWLWHKNLDVYILAPTPNNILKTLSHLNLNQITNVLAGAPEEHIKLFCEMLSQAYSLTTSEKFILYKLPIFCTASCITAKASKLVAAADLAAVDKDTVPAFSDKLKFPDLFIKCRDEADRRLLQQMQIRLLSARDVALLITMAIQNGRYSAYPAEAEEAMLWILRNGHVLFSQNDQLKNICRNLSFVPCNGSFEQPSAFFDPNISILKKLFESHRFPPLNFCEDSILTSLKQLGIKDSVHKITPDDVLQIAETLSHASVHETSLRKAKALISVCNETVVLSQFTPHNLTKLCNLSWVPAKTPNSQMVFCEPVKIRDIMHCDIVEYSMPLTGDFKKEASAMLGLAKLPPPSSVIKSLKVLSQEYSQVNQFSLEIKLHNIYKYVQDHLSQLHSSLLSEVMIWNGDGFSNPDEIVLFYPESLDLRSFTKQVPPAYLVYKKLFTKCGVKETLSNEAVVNILHMLKQHLDNTGLGTYKDLKLGISILDWMKTNSVHGTDDLPIPVHSENNGFSLKPLSKALFCDIDKQNVSGAFDDTNCFIVHDEISMATAKFLNIQLLSTKVLKPEFFEAWGPKEPVTLRIKNILREYSEPSEIFKELLQNADDADARVCKFLVDRRKNVESRHTLIDPGMASCHGPALWSYNNSKFSDIDFINITRIGAATKETQPQKIGKFGLGFNTVYHITDVPAILSRSIMIIFDPNVNHLQKHIPSNNPGIKLNLQKNSEPLYTFPGQFQPFIGIFGCKFAQPFDFDGTLIRLPFRTKEEAHESKICHQTFSEKEINMLINDFESFADILTIFIKNVKEVELNCLNNGSDPNDQLTKVHLQKEILKILMVPQTVLIQNQQIVKAQNLNVPIETLDISTSKIIKVSVRGQVTGDEKYYLVQSSLGVHESFQMFIQDAKIFSFPVSGVAVPLKKNCNTGKWTPISEHFMGMVFCYLPLPMSTGLPFHINGAFAVMSNRKNLWDTTEKGDWNRKLLCDALLIAVITVLSQLQILHKNGDLQDYCYYTFWPNILKVNTFLTTAVKSFYQAITYGIRNSLPALISNGQEWCTLIHACFLELEDFQNEDIECLAKNVFSSLLKKPYLAVSLPQWVRESFSLSGCLQELQKNSYNTERFYKEILLENVNAVNAKDRDKLVLYAIDLQNKRLDSILTSKPCIPSSDGKLQLIGKLVHPMGKVSVLYDDHEGRFPVGDEFLKSERLERLLTLGMLKDRLPMSELLAKARGINDVWRLDKTKALKQIHCVLELLNNILQQEPNAVSCGEFREIVFLPSIPLHNGNASLRNLTLMKSNELFHYKHRELVCLVKPVLSKEHMENIKLSNSLLSFLGLDQAPSLPIVFSQLEKACREPNLLKAGDILQVAKKCYSFLNKQIQKQPFNAAEIKEKSSRMPFVYVDDEFVSLKVVAKKVPFDALPYLHKLPKDYETLAPLWTCVGLRDEFSNEDYFSVLQQMAVNKREMPLSANEFQLALNLINNSLEKLATLNIHNPTDLQHVFIPDKQCVLRPIDKIFYYDTPWLPCGEDLHICHERVPRAVVSKMGVKTKIHHTLQKLKICSLTKWVSQFGAKEQLTTRIKNIIKEYSSKKDILKELIQNADDSEASEIHFVVDCRTHQTERTFGPQWNPLQGPALCVYNNRQFQSKDIDGIQQLGIGGKDDQLHKTGKFGLGFNSVYHITDCPSFVTGDTTLCIFDPNLMFLETAEDYSPGGMFSVNDEFKVTFKDVYDTFLPSVFNLEEGTLFRLPLRTANTVLKSKISDQTSSLEDLKVMFEELKNDADNMILFLNNIRRICFSEITASGHFHELLCIESKIHDEDKELLLSFQQNFSKLDWNSVFSDNLPFQVCYRVQIEKNGSRKVDNWLVAKQVGLETMDMHMDLKKVSDHLHEPMIPHGAVAAHLCLPSEGKAFCTLPLPLKTGLPVHVNANFIVDSARRSMCKEDGNSPKTEWNMFLLVNLIAPLYCCLLKWLCEMFTKQKGKPLLFDNVHSAILFLDRYLKYFPAVTEPMPPEWKTLVKEVYLTIFKKKAPVIPIYKEYEVREKCKKCFNIEWSNIGKTSIVEEPIFLSRDEFEAIGYILQNINMQLAFGGTNNFLYKEMKEAGIPVPKLSPETLCEFLRHCQLLPSGQVLPAPVSMSFLKNVENCNRLLDYCLKDCLSKKEVDLQGVPLLVTMDKVLHTYDKNDPKFSSTFSKLFPDVSNQFAVYRQHSLKERGFLKSLTIKNSVIFVKSHLGQLHYLSSSKSTCGLTLSKEKEMWLKKLWEFFESEIVKQKGESKKAHFEIIVSEYKQWAILPVHFKEELKILSFEHIKDMIYPRDNDVAKYLLKLGLPKLQLYLFPSQIIDFLLSYLLDPGNTERVLEHLSCKRDLHWELMDNGEMNMFLYLILSEIRSQKKQKNINNLKCLPLFETLDGKRQRLSGWQKVYVLNNVSSLDLLKLSEINTQTVFLKNSDLNKQAASILNVPIINEVQLLTEFLLPHIGLLCERQLLGVLRLVLEQKRCQDFQSKKDEIFSSLRCTKLIISKQGVLEQVSYFYDHSVALFCTFGLQDYFIPSDLLKIFMLFEPEFRMLLHELGLKHSLTEEDVITFASQVEKEAKSMCRSKSLTSKANGLFDYLLSMNMDKVSNDFASEIGKIAFIIPLDIQEELKALHPTYVAKYLTVPLKGSLLDRNSQHLVWTSMTLIKTHTTKKQTEFLKRCGVLFEPPVQKVIENMKNICDSQCNNQHFITRSQVLKSAYVFLQKYIDDVDHHSLENVSFILVESDTLLAKPRQIVFNLQNHNDFRPYLYKLPPVLACFSDLFQKIGVEEEASIFHFIKVFSTIYEETLDKVSLHANLKKTVSETMKQFFKLLEKLLPRDLQSLGPLYLPAINGKLYESSELILNDCRYFSKMLEQESTFKFLHTSLDHYETKDLLKLLPVAIRPRLLSEITEESINAFEGCVMGEDCTTTRNFLELLLSPIFCDGLVCLLRKQTDGKITQKEAEQTCSNILGKIQIVCCRKLQTSLMYDNNILKGTALGKTVFVRYADMCCKIYIKHAERGKSKFLQVLHFLAREIDNLIGNSLSSSSLNIVSEMLACTDPKEMIEVLKEYNIWNKKKFEIKNSYTLPKPGENIPNEWYDCLDMSILNTLKVGDYVGYMVPGEDEQYLYAVVVEELDLKVFRSCELPMYLIDIGQEENIEVSVLDLYQFKRLTSSNSKALVPLSNPPPPQQTSDKWFESSMEKIKADIDLQLNQIWQLPQAEKIKAIRRLYLKYHPDKNVGQENISNEIFKYLQQKVKELESGGKKGNHTSPHKHSSTFQGFSTFWGKWDREANHHRQNRERFSRTSRSNYDFWRYHSETKPNPSEAERWLRQAECDLKAAKNDVGQYTEWVFYKVHQAVEKALNAAQYIKKGSIDKNVDIDHLARKVSTYCSNLHGICNQVSQMKALGVDNKGTQYPNFHPPPQIPNDSLSSDKEKEVIELAENVLLRIKGYVYL